MQTLQLLSRRMMKLGTTTYQRKMKLLMSTNPSLLQSFPQSPNETQRRIERFSPHPTATPQVLNPFPMTHPSVPPLQRTKLNHTPVLLVRKPLSSPAVLTRTPLQGRHLLIQPPGRQTITPDLLRQLKKIDLKLSPTLLPTHLSA
jgi:hypothetical protein